MLNEEKIWEKIAPEPNTGCWLWTGTIYSNGYPYIWVDQKRYRAHRLVFAFYKGYWPKLLDHLCREKSCVNPSHLEDTTVRINTLRGISPAAMNAKKTKCKRGHELSGENLGFHNRASGKNSRYCRMCYRAQWAKDNANE